MSFVSIILPTYNRSSIIKRSIQSVLDQTYTDFELIIVDDGSTDTTGNVVKNIYDKRINYIRWDENKGPGAARNEGIRVSHGELLAFQDSDDEWANNKLEIQVDRLTALDRNWGMVYSDMLWIPEEGLRTYWHSPIVQKGSIVNQRKTEYAVANIGIQSCLIRRECLDHVGLFNDTLPALEDMELFIRISRRYDLCHISIPLVYYYESKDGVCSSRARMIRARRQILKLHRKYLKREKKFLAHQYQYYSSCYLDEFLKRKKFCDVWFFGYYFLKGKLINF